ncbi:hypothetical protein HVTV-2_gp172 [Haloarcula virus HVTV-2]|uniref:Uncharacterized protein n=1 Tax=Haloarcula vallismortis tailed virus 1 TaxID=1262528 RepID=L7TH42_9CAUD|nr:hypothetical protein HVTV1_170 [Haloarcula vallismortis tailed virus 1]AGC34539.1 hypothetical protein HVTV1_170 [Haloarcula vallismortis tailed virus 1]UBF22979.1 hypothetical protein HVTV-2_gp172 [Haloarcula virus HVTV-2]
MTPEEKRHMWLRLHWDVPPTTSRKKEFWERYMRTRR